jgi:ribosomal protein L7Ae-like RNA K-turn-binding protein
LQRDEFWCVVLASDASPRAIEKVVALAKGKDVPLVPGPSADYMGVKLGRPPVMVVGVRDRSLAEGILELGRKPD